MANVLQEPVPLSGRLRKVDVPVVPLWIERLMERSGIHSAAAEAARAASAAANEAMSRELEAARGRLAMAAEGYTEALVRLEEAIAQAQHARSRDAATLAILVARELVGGQAALRHEALAKLLCEALETTDQQMPVRIRICPEDLNFVRERRPSLLSSRLSFQADPSLGPGGFVLDMASQTMDASIETRLANVREALVRFFETNPEEAPAEAHASGEFEPRGEGEG